MILADFRYLMFSFRILINFGYNILMKSTPGPEIKMPIVSDTDGALPSPAIDLVSAKSKIDPMRVLGGVLIALIAVVGIILIVEGILLEQRSPEVSLPTIVVETVAEDCVGERPVNFQDTEGDSSDGGNSSEKPSEASGGANSSNIPASSRTYAGENCTLMQGPLMLINPVFQVKSDYIAARKRELVDIAKMYQIKEGVPGNGSPLLDSEAAVHLNAMIKAYQAAYPRHNIETRSCFRATGTNCGRLCYATGTTDHHTGYTCDLIDPSYGTSLNTDDYDKHIEWQWLKENSYKYGFIDRFPAAWAGGSMSEPVNINAKGSTGLYETWHYRYVGVDAATEIATGKYNNGQYDSLEHYLKTRGIVDSLTAGTCRQ